jgi:putative transposase
MCSANIWWNVFGERKRGRKTQVGAPAHDDLVRRQFRADIPNKVWLTDITQHCTAWIPAVVATLGSRCV